MNDFTLEIPNIEETKKEVAAQIAPAPEVKQQIAVSVENKVAEVIDADLTTYESRKVFVDAFTTFGSDALAQSQSKNAILERKIGDFSKAGGESSEVAKDLSELAIKVKDLDPSGIDFIKKSKFFNPVRKYFEKYKSADAEIAAIIKSLDKGKKTLVVDTTTLEIEQGNMRETAKKLLQYTEMGLKLDEYLTVALEKVRATGDEEKAKFIEEDLLYPLRQRIQDFQQLAVVNQQGIIAMEIIRKNNKELIRSVDRAKLVTVSALRTAVTVAGALYDQKIVLEKVQALNATTEHMIQSTAKMLKEQGTEIQKEASSTAISADALKAAFADTIQALDDISTYKQQALPKMQEAIEQFREMAEEGERQLNRMDKANAYMEGE